MVSPLRQGPPPLGRGSLVPQRLGRRGRHPCRVSHRRRPHPALDGLFGIKKRSDEVAELGRNQQRFFLRGHGNARPVLANAVRVFFEVGRTVTDSQGVNPDQSRRRGVRVRVANAELRQVSPRCAREIRRDGRLDFLVADEISQWFAAFGLVWDMESADGKVV